MPANHRRRGGRARPAAPKKFVSKQAYLGGAVRMERWERSSEKALLEKLSSTLLDQERELKRLVHVVGNRSSSLNLAAPGAPASTHELTHTIEHVAEQSDLDMELWPQAFMDDLTGLHNRRGFLALAGRQLRRTHRNAHALLLFFVDVDNLKEINDSYGPHEGDLVLVRVAETLGKTFRDSDILARLAPDEFTALVADTSGQDLEEILLRLEEGLKKSQANEFRYDLSISISVVRLDPKQPVSLEGLLKRADGAMYQNKRNQPRVWQN